MNADELDPESVDHDSSAGKKMKWIFVRRKTLRFFVTDSAVNIQRASFTWDGGEIPTLKDINFEVKPGKLVAVDAQVGAGKSLLISAMLGEMDKITGNVNTKGRIAYLPQQAWIQNCSLKNNILFGKPLDLKSYSKVLDACALKPDLALLPGGDETEIGVSNLIATS